jgi:GMP synthase (glutamine-hydrolysing)
MAAMKKLLIVKVGDTLPELAARTGDFEDWFIDGLDVEASHLLVFDPRSEADFPPYEQLAGVLVTGSHTMVTERQPWSERVAQWLPSVVERGIPTLGVCYGHQLLAHAFGGEVGDNPNGTESGTKQVTLNEHGQTDRLLGGLGTVLEVQESHTQSVLALPRGAKRLASNAWDMNQAFVINDCAWGVQFHPEIKLEMIRTYIEADRQELLAENQNPDELLEQCHATPVGGEILRSFARLALEKK